MELSDCLATITESARSRTLSELTRDELGCIQEAYQSLSERKASDRVKNGKKVAVSSGPTGASKILFAIRPEAIVPWDTSIRDTFGVPYAEFLERARLTLRELETASRKHGLELADLPKRLNRPQSTLAKLIDEYYWITISNNCPAPDADTLNRWVEWSK